jgi:hypothetical protein
VRNNYVKKKIQPFSGGEPLAVTTGWRITVQTSPQLPIGPVLAMALPAVLMDPPISQ